MLKSLIQKASQEDYHQQAFRTQPRPSLFLIPEVENLISLYVASNYQEPLQIIADGRRKDEVEVLLRRSR